MAVGRIWRQLGQEGVSWQDKMSVGWIGFGETDATLASRRVDCRKRERDRPCVRWLVL